MLVFLLCNLLTGLIIGWLIIDFVRTHLQGTYGYFEYYIEKNCIDMEKIKPKLDLFCIDKDYNWNHEDYIKLIESLQTKKYKDYTRLYYTENKENKYTLLYNCRNNENPIGNYLEQQKKLHKERINIINTVNKRLGIDENHLTDPSITV
jgi:hypothetical protein